MGLQVHLLRNHPDLRQPRLYQLRPSRHRKLRAPQSERVPALRIQMHLHGNTNPLQRGIVGQRVLHTVNVVILILEQKRRWCLEGDAGIDIRIQPKAIVSERQMPRISLVMSRLFRYSAKAACPKSP